MSQPPPHFFDRFDHLRFAHVMTPSPRTRTYVRGVTITALSFALLVGCSSTSSNGSTSAPSGVNQSIWDDYCSHGVALTSYIRQQVNGTLTRDEFASKLAGSENGIAGDASATPGPIGVQLQTLADAIGHLKVAVASGDPNPNYNELTTAVAALPTCNKG